MYGPAGVDVVIQKSVGKTHSAVAVRWIWSRIPALFRAFILYITRFRDPGIILIMLLEREVEAEIDAITDQIFTEVERELRVVFQAGFLKLDGDAEEIKFDYDTRLLLPAMLAHGRLHTMANDLPILRHLRSTEEDLLARAQETTLEIVRALLDGDMRDAINDGEYVDFETTVRPRSTVAEIAQKCLQSDVEKWFDRDGTPKDVRKFYEHAVQLSERHQDQDREYRELLKRYHTASGDEQIAAEDQIRERYKLAAPDESPELFRNEYRLPYFGTQYERVGIIYEDMLNMYEADLDIEFSEDFKRSIVLMVIAAQIGLDDTDDYPEDRRSQLTPVTAELNINGKREGLLNLRNIISSYLDRAIGYSDNHLSGMAIEYIYQQAMDRLDILASQVSESSDV